MRAATPLPRAAAYKLRCVDDLHGDRRQDWYGPGRRDRLQYGGHAMSQSSDQIRRGIERDRQEAGEKVDELEQHLEDRADQLKQQAQDTVEHFRDEAGEMLHDTMDTVKENMDLQQQVQDHPLPAVAAALVGGFLLGSAMNEGGGGGGQSGESFGSTILRTAEESGLVETAENLAAALVGSVTEQVRTTIMPSK